MKRESAIYVHGVGAEELARLRKLNVLTNPPFINFVGVQAGELVLEVGSGPGILAAEVARSAQGARVVGIECAPEQLHEASAIASASVGFARADAHSLPFPDDLFDRVYCRYVLEHVREPREVLAEMRRVLKPGCRVAVQENDTLLTVFDPDCPAADHIVRQFIRLQALNGGDGRVGKRLFGLLVRSGFREVEIDIQPELHASGMPTFATWVENLIAIIKGASEGLLRSKLASHDEIDTALAELAALMQRPDAQGKRI